MILRFQEAIVWNSGKFTVDARGHVWRGNRRAEKTAGEYLQVRVMVNGRRYYTCAHRLVWHALRGPIPFGMVINHKNGVKTDNRPENLELSTYSANLSHAHRNGLLDQRGELNPAARLTNRQVAEIRLRYSSDNISQSALGAIYSVSPKTISKIVRGERRASQPGIVANYIGRRRHSKSNREQSGRFTKAFIGREHNDLSTVLP